MFIGDYRRKAHFAAPWLRQVTALVFGLALLGLIYSYIGIDELIARTAEADPWVTVLGFAFLVPIVGTTALRLQRLTPEDQRMSYSSAVALTLSSGSLNLVLPSRLGDLAKAYFMAERRHVSGPLAVALVVYERLSDLFGLFVCCALGLAFLPGGIEVDGSIRVVIVAGLASTAALVLGPAWIGRLLAMLSRWAPRRVQVPIARFTTDWDVLSGYLLSHPRVIASVLLLAVVNWILGIVQVWIFSFALGFALSMWMVFALAPLALLFGMVPVSLAGVGTRDAALIYFFAPVMTPAGAAALGLFCTFRYVLWAAAGLPFFSRYVGGVGLDRACARQERPTGDGR